MSPNSQSSELNFSKWPGVDSEPVAHTRVTESLLNNVLLLTPQPFYKDRCPPIAVRQFKFFGISGECGHFSDRLAGGDTRSNVV